MTGAPAFWKRMGRNSPGQEIVSLPGRKWRGEEVSGVTLGRWDPPSAFSQKPAKPRTLLSGGSLNSSECQITPQPSPPLKDPIYDLESSSHLQASNLPPGSLHSPLPLPGSHCPPSPPPTFPDPSSIPNPSHLSGIPFSSP